MARFLFSVLPARGHIYPSLPIAQALRARGHEVAYITSPSFAALLASLDISCFPLDEPEAIASLATPAYQKAEPTSARTSEPTSARTMKGLFRTLFIAPAAATARSVERAMDVFQPDVLVHDRRSWGPSLAAERAALPWATLSLTCCNLPGADLAPFGAGLPPAHDAATRLRYAALRERGEAFFADVKAEWNALRAGFGLPPHHGPLATAALSPDLLVLLGVPELDYERADLPPSAHYVGACSWDPPEALDHETATWLAALPPETPLALVSASTATFGGRPDRRSAALVEAALAGLPELGIAVLATLPFDHPLHAAPPAPYRRLARFAPHSLMLPRANVVVTHGGFGAVLKALSHGLPVVAVPFAGDQPEVAQRVAVAGAGLRLDPAALTPEALRAAVQTVLEDGTYRGAATRLATALRRHDGPAEAAALLEQCGAGRALPAPAGARI